MSCEDYGEWGPYFSSVDAFRIEKGLLKLTAEQISETSKAMDRVMVNHTTNCIVEVDQDIMFLPDQLIEALLTVINDIDRDACLITAITHTINRERINTVLKEHRTKITMGASNE